MRDDKLRAFCRKDCWPKAPLLFTVFRRQFRFNDPGCVEFEGDYGV